MELFTEQMDANVRFIAAHYGLRNQAVKTNEELGELVSALSRQLNAPSVEHKANLVEEIGDAYIMLRQIRLLMGIDDLVLRGSMIGKIYRTINDINNEVTKNGNQGHTNSQGADRVAEGSDRNFQCDASPVPPDDHRGQGAEVYQDWAREAVLHRVNQEEHRNDEAADRGGAEPSEPCVAVISLTPLEAAAIRAVSLAHARASNQFVDTLNFDIETAKTLLTITKSLKSVIDRINNHEGVNP